MRRALTSRRGPADPSFPPYQRPTPAWAARRFLLTRTEDGRALLMRGESESRISWSTVGRSRRPGARRPTNPLSPKAVRTERYINGFIRIIFKTVRS